MPEDSVDKDLDDKLSAWERRMKFKQLEQEKQEAEEAEKLRQEYINRRDR